LLTKALSNWTGYMIFEQVPESALTDLCLGEV